MVLTYIGRATPITPINETRIIRSLDNGCFNRVTGATQISNLPSNKKISEGRHAVINISPVKKRKPTVPQKLPVPIPILELAQFKRPPVVEFGTVIKNQIKIMPITVRNLESFPQELRLASLPSQDKGFFIELEQFVLNPKSQITLAIKWVPTKAGRYRESINFHDGNRFPFRIIVVGCAIEPEIIKPTQRRLIAPTAKNSPGRLSIRTREPIKPELPIVKKASETNPKPIPVSTLILNHRKRWSGLLVRHLVAKREKDEAARKIQHFFRMVKDRRRYLEIRKIKEQARNDAAALIQAKFRSYVARRRYLKLKQSITSFQSRFRMLLAKRQLEQLRDQRVIENRAAFTIQTKYRSYLIRKEFLHKKHAAVRIQSYIRMCQAKKRYTMLQTSTLFMQCQIRTLLAKRQLSKLTEQRALENHWASIIQTKYRAHLIRKEYLRKKKAAVCIQCYTRMRQARKRYVELQRSTLFVQRQIRMLLAKRKLYKLKEQRAMENRSASIIQAKFRSYAVRNRYLAAMLVIRKVRSQMRLALTMDTE